MRAPGRAVKAPTGGAAKGLQTCNGCGAVSERGISEG